MQRIEKKEGHSEATAEESSRNKASIFYWILRFAQYDVGFIVTSWRLSLRGVCCACFGNLSLSFIKPSLRGVQRRGNLSLMIMLLLLVSNQALAQTPTCSAPPSCSALGFDKGAGDCSGQAILRCPFDQSKVFCAGIVPGSGSGETPGAGASGACTGKCLKYVDCRGASHVYKLSETVLSAKYKDQDQACRDLKEDGRLWMPVSKSIFCENASGTEVLNFAILFAPWIKEEIWGGDTSSWRGNNDGTTCLDGYGCEFQEDLIKDYEFIRLGFRCTVKRGEALDKCLSEIKNIRCVSEYMQ